MKEGKSSRRKSSVYNIQLLLWTLLVLLQIAVVYCLDGKAEEQPAPALEISVFLEAEPEPVWTDEAGNHYELVSWQPVSRHQPARTRLVKETLCYERIEGGSAIPRELTVPVTDGEQTFYVVCRLQEQSVLQEEWQEGFAFPVVFHLYGAGFYQLGDRLITGNEESPELTGCEALLLAQIGVSPAEYRITFVQWSGGSYLDDQGEMCRNATAFGQKLVRDYQVTYVGEAVLPERRISQIKANYRLAGPKNEVRTGETVDDLPESSEAPAFTDPTDVPGPPLSRPGSWWRKMIDTLLVTVGIGAILFFGGLAMFLLLKIVKARNNKKS